MLEVGEFRGFEVWEVGRSEWGSGWMGAHAISEHLHEMIWSASSSGKYSMVTEICLTIRGRVGRHEEVVERAPGM